MTAATTPYTRPNQHSSIASQVANGIYEIGVSAASGALAGYVFSLINPIGGAVFGAATAFGSIVANALIDRLGIDETASKVAVWAISFVASLVIGICVTTAAGFSITVLSALGMALAMVLTSIVVRITIDCMSGCYGTDATRALMPDPALLRNASAEINI